MFGHGPLLGMTKLPIDLYHSNSAVPKWREQYEGNKINENLTEVDFPKKKKNENVVHDRRSTVKPGMTQTGRRRG